nr:retrotransposon Orf1 [Tanacetum cinerariifolium]
MTQLQRNARRQKKNEWKRMVAQKTSTPDPSISFITEKFCKLKSFLESLNLVSRSFDVKFVCTKENDGDVMFFEIIKKYDDSSEEELGEGESIVIGGLEDISSIIDPRLSQVVLGKPFVEISNVTHDLSLGVVKFTNETNVIAYKMPHKIEQYNSLSELEKEHTKSVYIRNEEDKRRGVECVMSKILGFYKECLELETEYLTGLEKEGGVT